MTTTHTDPLRALLADLTTKLDAATDGPWRRNAQPGVIFGNRPKPIAAGYTRADAALIVALRNHTPALIAAVKAAADLVDFYDRHEYSTLNVDDLRAALAAAVPADTEENAR